MASIEQVRSALKNVHDPQMNQGIILLNMLKGVTIQDGVVKVAVELKIPDYPFESELKNRIQAAVAPIEGVEDVQVSFTSRLMRTPGAKQPIPGVKNIIAVYACKGGVGKSTVAVNLAVALHKSGYQVGVLDADIHGPNVPLMMGIQDSPKGTKDNKLYPLENHGIKLMSIGFLTEAALPSIWRGPMVHGAIQQLLRDTLWGELDYLIVDLPPGTGDAQLTVIQSTPVAGVLLVTSPQKVSLIDGIKGINLFRKFNIPVLGMIENMSGFVCPHCRQETDIFSRGGGEMDAKANHIPFLGRIPLDPHVVVSGDTGIPVVLSHPDSPVAKAFADIAKSIAR